MNKRDIFYMIVVSIIVIWCFCITIQMVTYMFYTTKMNSVENQAEEGYWTENGMVHWDPTLEAQYNEAKLKRSEVVEKYDFLQFHQSCAETSHGRVIRIILYILITAIDIMTIAAIGKIFYLLWRRIKRRKRRKRRRY